MGRRGRRGSIRSWRREGVCFELFWLGWCGNVMFICNECLTDTHVCYRMISTYNISEEPQELDKMSVSDWWLDALDHLTRNR